MSTYKEVLEDIPQPEIERLIRENSFEKWSYFIDPSQNVVGIIGANKKVVGLFSLTKDTVLRVCPAGLIKIGEGKFNINENDLTLRLSNSSQFSDVAVFNDKNVINDGEKVEGPALDAELKKTLRQWNVWLHIGETETEVTAQPQLLTQKKTIEVRYAPWPIWAYTKPAILEIDADMIKISLKTDGKVLLSARPINVRYDFGGFNFLLLSDSNTNKPPVRLMFSNPTKSLIVAVISLLLMGALLIKGGFPPTITLMLFIIFAPFSKWMEKTEAKSVIRSGFMDILKSLNLQRNERLIEADSAQLEHGANRVGRWIAIAGGGIVGALAGFLVWYKLFKLLNGSAYVDLNFLIEWSFVAIPGFISVYAVKSFFQKKTSKIWLIFLLNFTFFPLLYGYILSLLIR